MKKDCDAVLHPQEDPEVVALGGQTIEEVKDILKKAGKAACEAREKIEKETADLFTDFKGEEPKYRYSYQGDMHDECGMFDLRTNEAHGFRKDVDIFAMWRRLADVNLGDKELQPKVVRLTQDLMDYVLMKLEKQFPKLTLAWSSQTWNPRLLINNCPTQISMERLGLAYQGLLNVTEDLSAQTLLADIVTKKMKELFI